MTTSQLTPFLLDVLDSARIAEPKLAYFRARFKHRLHAFVLTEFVKMEQENGFTKADLARRLGKKPEQITRWLSAPGNWTLDTLSDLLLGMKSEPLFAASRLANGAVQPTNEAWNLPNGHFDTRPGGFRLPNAPAANDPNGPGLGRMPGTPIGDDKGFKLASLGSGI